MWCFYTSPEEAKARVMRRNGLTGEEAAATKDPGLTHEEEVEPDLYH